MFLHISLSKLRFLHIELYKNYVFTYWTTWKLCFYTLPYMKTMFLHISLYKNDAFYILNYIKMMFLHIAEYFRNHSLNTRISLIFHDTPYSTWSRLAHSCSQWHVPPPTPGERTSDHLCPFPPCGDHKAFTRMCEVEGCVVCSLWNAAGLLFLLTDIFYMSRSLSLFLAFYHLAVYPSLS